MDENDDGFAVIVVPPIYEVKMVLARSMDFDGSRRRIVIKSDAYSTRGIECRLKGGFRVHSVRLLVLVGDNGDFWSMTPRSVVESRLYADMQFDLLRIVKQGPSRKRKPDLRETAN